MHTKNIVGNLKLLAQFAGMQFLMYTILVFNIRVIAANKVAEAMVTDAIYATMLFYVIHKVAKSDSRWAWAGYVIGSVMGTWVGMKG